MRRYIKHIVIFVILVGIFSIIGVCIYQKYEVERVRGKVTKTEWTCRTSLQEEETQMILTYCGENCWMLIPSTNWVTVEYKDAIGYNFNYSCAGFEGLSYGQKQVFDIDFYVTFDDKLIYQPDDYKEFLQFIPNSNWMLGLNNSGKVINFMSLDKLK